MRPPAEPAAVNSQERRPVPSEYVGKARMLHRRVQQVDGLVTPIIDAAMAPLRERLRRHPGRPLREGDLIDARRVWRSTPGFGRIGQSIDISDRRAPAFRELRVSAVRLGTALWREGDSADGLAVSLVMARVHRGRLTVTPVILASCTIHALARRLSRSWDTTDEAVFWDLASLAFHYPQLIDEAAETFVLPLAEGKWAGRRLLLDKYPALLAQTFFNDAMPVEAPMPAAMSLEALISSLPAMAVTVE